MSLLSLLLLRLPCLSFRHLGQSQLLLVGAVYTDAEPKPLLTFSSTALMSKARTCQSCTSKLHIAARASLALIALIPS